MDKRSSACSAYSAVAISFGVQACRFLPFCERVALPVGLSRTESDLRGLTDLCLKSDPSLWTSSFSVG
jgi:hypothetical protein